MPPGRPPRSSSRLSDLSQSAATICINVPVALNWKEIKSKYIILNWNLKFQGRKTQNGALQKKSQSEFIGDIQDYKFLEANHSIISTELYNWLYPKHARQTWKDMYNLEIIRDKTSVHCKIMQ